MEKEIPISKSIGNNLPYDFIIELNSKLLKIQVKTAYKSKSKNVWIFNTRSCSKNYNEVVKKDYIGKIDYFAVVVQENPYLIIFVPVSKASKGSMSIYCGSKPRKKQNCFSDFKTL